MSGVRGNGLKALTVRMQAMKSPAFKAELATVLSATAVKLVADEFRKEQNPYGVAWKPLARQRTRRSGQRPRKRGDRILQDTGRMRGSVAVEPLANGFRLDIATKYAAAHQYGATIAPHSRARTQVMWQNPKTGRIVGRNTRLKLVTEHKFRQTFANGIVIPRRQMIPDEGTGGLGPIWKAAFDRDTKALIARKGKGD